MSKYINEFSYVLSIVSLISLWLIGNKNKYGFVVAILNQGLWTWYAIMLKHYGLFLGVVAYTIIHVRNLIKWSKDKNNGRH